MNQSPTSFNTKIKFNKKFYSINAIQKAAEAFAEFFDLITINEPENILVELNLQEEDPIIIQEFCNYVLGSMQNIRKEIENEQISIQ